jgi:Secretion system C-terminal sorting domain
MKKFYIPIFAAVFLLTSFYSQGQIYNSITSNPSHYTLDDGLFWQGGVAPPAGCTGCAINIYTDVSVVQNGFSSVPAYNTCLPACNFLNDVKIYNSTINLYGSATLSINTYLELFNTNITLGNDPVSMEYIKVNDQVDLNGTSTIVLANNLTTVDAINLGIVPVLAGPHDDFFSPPGTKSPGIFGIIPPDMNGYTYTYVLNGGGLGSSTNEYFPSPGISHYILNCNPPGTGSPNTCGDGLVFGPATTVADGAFGTIFIGSTTLPVQLVQFLATKNDDGSVKISWATSQEENSNYYDVERSTDQSTWTSIGTVKAKGFSSTTTNYFLTDKSPVNGTGYYRLKMVDLDGKFTYSKAIPITTDQTSTALVIYSNPFSDQIRLKINVSRPQNLLLTVTDILGKTYIAQSYQAQSGDNYVNLQPSASSSGMYILRIQGDTYNQTVKLEKQ